MINILDISESQEIMEQFIDFGVHHNASYSKSLPRAYDNEAALLDEKKNFFFRYGGSLKAFIATHNNRVVGRIGAMINPTIRYNHSTPGLIGLFEVEDDYETARFLLTRSIQWFRKKGIKVILGPMDFSIWHNYRFMVDGADNIPFIGEPRNPQYYADFFKGFGFGEYHQWQSRLLNIEGIKGIMKRFKGQEEIFDSLSYSLVRITNENVMETLRIAYQLIMDSYKNFDLFSHLSVEEFIASFKYLPGFLDRDLSCLAKNDRDEYIGFIFVLKDPSDILTGNNFSAWMNTNIELPAGIGKYSIANLYQGGTKISAIREAWKRGKKNFNVPLSPSRAVLYKIFRHILENGKYNHVLFPLMREGAPNKNYSNGLYTQERNYYLYRLNIG